MISGPTVTIKEKENGIEIKQGDQIFYISNINDINLLIDSLKSLKHKFFLQRSGNYNYVYNKLNGQI